MSDLLGNPIVGFPTRWLIYRDAILAYAPLFQSALMLSLPFCVITNLYLLFEALFAKLTLGFHHLSRLMGKPTICICESKDADQLRGNFCFRYSDSPIPLLLESEISSF